MSEVNRQEIELTLIECSGGLRKKTFLVSEIESIALNGSKNTLLLTRRGGYWPIKESIEEILDLMKFSDGTEEGAATVMCPVCLREVGAMEKCPVCGAKLKDSNGFFVHPMEPLEFGDEFVQEEESSCEDKPF